MSDGSPTQPTASQRHRAREAVIQALYQWELSGYPMKQVAAMFRADNDLKRADIAFFNDGSCVHPRSITGIEIESGKISLIKWQIVTTEDGTLKIDRFLLEGPTPLIKYKTE